MCDKWGYEVRFCVMRVAYDVNTVNYKVTNIKQVLKLITVLHFLYTVINEMFLQYDWSEILVGRCHVLRAFKMYRLLMKIVIISFCFEIKILIYLARMQ